MTPDHNASTDLPRKNRSNCWRIGGGLAVLLAAALGYQQANGIPQITVSKETTYITRPLRPDGLPDYERWLLERYRDGVTHENNAGFLIYQAVWPAELEPAHYQPVCDELGLAAVPSEDGALHDFPNEELVRAVRTLLVGRGMEAVDNDFAEEAIAATTEAPWTAKDLPPLADWLTENQRTIDLVVEASRRPRLYLPSPSLLDDEHVTLVVMLLPGTQGSRDAARPLAVRSMWHLGEGRFIEAWDDAFALHRFGNLLSQGFSLVEKIVAISILRIAQDATLAILSQDEIPLELARQIQADLAKLNSPRPIAESLGEFERVSMLSAVVDMVPYGPGVLEGGPIDKQWSGATSLDWDIVTRRINDWFDKLEAAVAIEDHADRRKELKQIETELRAKEEDVKHPMTAVKAFFSRRARSESVANTFLTLLTPATEAALSAEYRNTTRSGLVSLAAALAVYRAEHGAYPAALGDLVPEVIAKLPVDSFNSGPFVYKRTDDGYLLYSAGENGADDGGSNQNQGVFEGQPLNERDEATAEPLWNQVPDGADDIAIRVPRPSFRLPQPASQP